MHRLETAKLLLDNGADPFARSRYGDDALQTSCLRGAHNIFNHLKGRITYSTERLASANELIGKLNNVTGYFHYYHSEHIHLCKSI